MARDPKDKEPYTERLAQILYWALMIYGGFLLALSVLGLLTVIP